MSLAEEAAKEAEKYYSKIDEDDLEESEKGLLWQETRDRIIELFLDEDWELDDRVVCREVQNSFQYSFSKEDDLTEHFEELIDDLKTETTFTAYIYFPRIVDLPQDTEIGDLEIISKPEDKERLIEHIDYLEEKGKLYEGRSWGKIEFKSLKERALLREELFKELKEPLSILSVALDNVSPPENLAGGIYTENGETIWFLEPEREPSGWTRYDENVHSDFLSKLTDIANKEEDRTNLEKNILSSIQLLTLHSHEYRNEHSFLALVAALEGSLLRKYESPKGSKLAEKTIQLLSDEFEDEEEKLEDYYRVKEWYKKRSEIIHGGSSESVGRADVRAVRNTIRKVIEELVDLKDEYDSLQKQERDEDTDRIGLNDYFLKERLGINSE